MDGTTSIRTAIWSQFGAGLDMLENAIAMCPVEHWDTASDFWYVSYHCTFWTDYYLTTAPAEFEPPAPFTSSEFDPTGRKPDRTYTKAEVLGYVAHCRQKAGQLIAGLTVERLAERWVNDRKQFSLLEILMYNLRHIQHHAAQLNLLLRQAIDQAPAWQGQAKSLTENESV